MPVITLQDAKISFGGPALFENLNLIINEGDKLCLIGRNGEGKSTLLKLMQGIIDLDDGSIYREVGLDIRYLSQQLVLPTGTTAFDYVRQFCAEDYEAHIVLDALGVDYSHQTEALSGGETRRILLAAALVGKPDVLLLDEPTNHLDIAAIQWLEEYIKTFRGTVVVISHDRTFLANTSNGCLWLDRGILRRLEKSFAYFEEWQEHVFADEERQMEKLNTHLRQELHWLQRGVTARRKRNQGRLRRLNEMRHFKRDLLNNKINNANMGRIEGEKGSHLIIEAHDIQKTYPGKLDLKPFSTRIMRADRIGIVGPNGVGKSTLIKMLTGLLEPDAGSVTLGENIHMVYFDQHRSDMDPNKTLWEYLCPTGGDQVIVQGNPKHVVGYLKEFLFDEHQIRGKISILSGGEKNRLALAKIFCETSNVCILDEPTNDLDMDTLDLLEDLLADYNGTLIIISHDRSFLDRLVNSVIAIDENGNISEHVGGYSDYLEWKNTQKSDQKLSITETKKTKETPKQSSNSKRLSYNDKRDYETFPSKIKDMETQLKMLEVQLHDGDLYTKNPDQFSKLTADIAKLQSEIDVMEMRWLELDEFVN